MFKDFLLEIGTEEIPARFMDNILSQIKEIAANIFFKNALKYSKIESLGTPRRIVLFIKSLPEKQSDRKISIKGPSIKVALNEEGAWTKAGEGFARSQNVELNSLVQKEGYIYANKVIKGIATQEILPNILTQIINTLKFSQTMRWGTSNTKFVRPIHWILALLDKDLIDMEFAGIKSNRFTFGHRFLTKEAIKINSINRYFTELTKNFVIIDQNERKNEIKKQIEKLASDSNIKVEIDEKLLNEVTYLVEYPYAFMGEFEKKYLKLPELVIITPMKEHQKYFPVKDTQGNLLNKFIAVRNGNNEQLDLVKKGNERVLRARLADAQFFFDEDCKVKPVNRVSKLEHIVFYEGLLENSLLAKTKRIKYLAYEFLYTYYGGNYSKGKEVDFTNLERAAYLSKTDLTTNIVGEFPELQGYMGREYALLAGENAEVADAIYEHYLPRFIGDSLPNSIIGKILSMVDKIDNICACIITGEIPTSSQDPHGIRRQIMAIVNILATSIDKLSIDFIIFKSLNNFNHSKKQYYNIKSGNGKDSVYKIIKRFFNQTLKRVLQKHNIRYDIIDAVLTINELNYPQKILEKADIINKVSKKDGFKQLINAYTRIINISKNYLPEQKQKKIDKDLFVEKAELQLYKAYREIENLNKISEKDINVSEYFEKLETLVYIINNFFDKILIMVDDEKVKNNRLNLLINIKELSCRFFNCTKIVG